MHPAGVLSLRFLGACGGVNAAERPAAGVGSAGWGRRGGRHGGFRPSAAWADEKLVGQARASRAEGRWPGSLDTLVKPIVYEFKLDNGEFFRFEVAVLGRQRPTAPSGGHAEWTQLEYHQCEHCPLKSADHPHCPVALDIEDIAQRFTHLLSYEEADVWVRTEERDYFKRCDVQSGLKSLLGLIMGSSGCPILSRFRPMAVFHLPFSSVEETIFRSTGTYLIRQYFAAQDGQRPDLELEGLAEFYQTLQQVNHDFMLRVRAASENDVSLNAVYILFSLSALVSLTLKSRLEELRPLYNLPPAKP